MKNLLFGFLFILPIMMSAQIEFSDDFDIKTGKPYKVIDASSNLYFPINGRYVISVKVGKKIVTLQLYDADKMEEIKRSEYNDFPKGATIQDVIVLDNRMYYIFYVFNKKDDNFSVYIREIITDDATFGKINKLFTTKSDVIGSPINPLNPYINGLFSLNKTEQKFNVYQSFDQSRIMIGYRNKPKFKDDDKNKDIIGIHVFDSEFNSIWNAEKEMPYTESDMNNLAYGISNKGTAYMLTFLNTSKSYMVLAFPENDALFDHKLDIDGEKMVQKLNIREDEEGNLIFAGFYANGIDVKVNWGYASHKALNFAMSFNTNGIFYFKMNVDGDIIYNRDFSFSIDFINQYQSSSQKNKANKRENDDKAGIEDLKMIEFIVNDDGSMIFIGEQQYMRKEYYGPKTKLVYHYYHLVMAKMDKNGKLEWLVKMPKNQAGLSGRGGIGAKYMQGNGKHYLLYLDNKKNANISIDDPTVPYKDGKEGFLTAYVVDDETGKVEKHLILSMRDINGIEAYQFKPSRIFFLKENQFMIEIYTKGKRDTMVKLELKN